MPAAAPGGAAQYCGVCGVCGRDGVGVLGERYKSYR
jgi:hypothetical protein